MSMSRMSPGAQQSATLVDLLDRVLDKGLVVAGDGSISLANVELLTIRIPLLLCSIDKAAQIGPNWWRYERALTGGPPRGGAGAQPRARTTQPPRARSPNSPR